MGIDYNNYMVFGWAIQYDNIVDYALDHELQCDCSDNQHTTVSMCKPHNFEISVEYEHFTFEIIRTCPWYNCDLVADIGAVVKMPPFPKGGQAVSRSISSKMR